MFTQAIQWPSTYTLFKNIRFEFSDISPTYVSYCQW